jgi:hypothetical protein
MAMISQGVLVLAMVWTLWQLVHVRRQLRRGAIVVPPLVAATLVFALGIIVVIVTGVSPLHLLWWFPCSFIIGLVVLVFPLGTATASPLSGAVSGVAGEQRATATAGVERRERQSREEQIPSLCP